MAAHDPTSVVVARPSGSRPGQVADGRSDLLSQVLTLIRLRGELIYTADLREPWALRFSPGSSHFHFVVEGRVIATPAGSDPVHVGEGELILLPRGGGHVLRSPEQTSAPEFEAFAPEIFDAKRLAIRHGGGDGPSTRLVSGTFHFDETVSPIVTEALPPIITVSRHDGANAPWLEALVHFLLAEAQLPAPGSGIMISRLIDVMVVQTLRSWATTNGRDVRGWLGGIADPQIGRALSSLHEAPMRDWTVQALADIAGMSRSVFAERFVERVGETPLRYLKHWRLALAADMLRSGTMKVGTVAHRVGYESDAAFSRAYKMRFGHTPMAARISAEEA